jgi:hypothetical protein
VRYTLARCLGIDGGGGMGGDAWCRPTDGIGLALVFGVVAGKGLINVATNFNIVCSVWS